MSIFKYQIPKTFALVALLAIGLAMAVPAWAQGAQVRLALSKAWGYSMGGQIQGLMNLSVAAPKDTTSVRFELDGEEITTVTRPPFSIQFNTDKYPRGWHKFSATVQTATGQTVDSNTISAEFVSAEQGWQVAQRIIVPLLVIAILAMLISTGGQFLLNGRGKQRPEPGAL